MKTRIHVVSGAILYQDRELCLLYSYRTSFSTTFDMESVSPNHLSSHLELPKVVSSNLQAHQYFLNSSLIPFPYLVKITLKREEFCVVRYAAARSFETSVNWYHTIWCHIIKQHSTYHILTNKMHKLKYNETYQGTFYYSKLMHTIIKS